MFLFTFTIFFLINIIKTQTTIDTEILKQNGGNQAIVIPIHSNDYTQLVITSNGYLIKLNSDTSIYGISNQIIPLKFNGIDSDACQLNNNLIVLLSSDDKKLTFFNINSESIIVSNDNVVNDYSDNGISLSCANDYFVIATSNDNYVTIKFYYKTDIYKIQTISNIIGNQITCTIFISLYTACFYSYNSIQEIYYTLYDNTFNFYKNDNVMNIKMEHQPNRDSTIIINNGVLSKRIGDDKVIFCSVKYRTNDITLFFCNVGQLKIGNTNPLYLADSPKTQEYAFTLSNTNKIRHCFIGVRSDDLYPAICRKSNDKDGSSKTKYNYMTVISVDGSNEFAFLSGQTATGYISILPNDNDQIINLVEFDNNGIGFILSDGTNTIISVYYPKCSSTFSSSFNVFPANSGNCYSSETTLNGYYYDPIYHKFIPLSGNAASCSRNSDLILICTCDNSNGYYPVPDDYEGSDYCWDKNINHNFYFFDNSASKFKKCYIGCLTCSQLGTSEKDTKCILCDNTINLSSSTNSYYPVIDSPTNTNNILCIDKDTIIIGYYFNTNTNQFEKCDNSCKYCSNESTSPTTLCSECALNYYSKSTTSSPNLECYLYSTSLDNWYVDAAEKLFKPCIESCKKCDKTYMENSTIVNKCTECNNNYYILSNEDNSIPVPNFSCRNSSTKPENTILVSLTQGSQTINIYQYCNKACSSCTEISDNVENPKCVSNACSNNYYPLITDSTICINEVIKEDYFIHFFLNSNSGKYEECNIECNTCSNYNNYCDQCSNTYYFLMGTKFCYNESTKEVNFILNTDSAIPYYELCYENCLSCVEVGDETDNKCTSCSTDHFLNPFKPGQCTLICEDDEYFYVDTDSNYICVESCPNDYPYLDESTKRCFDDCRNNIDNGRVFLFENKCVQNCPDDTVIGSANKCVDGESCRKSYFKLKNDITIINDTIPNLINSYMEYYSSINQHVNIYKNTNSKYTIVIYKNETCINDIKNEIHFPNLEECLNKIKDTNLISRNTLLTILLFSSTSSQIEYKIYNNNNNIELSKKPCENLKTNVIVNIPEEYADNLTKAKNLYDKYGINVYDINDPFFTDVCYEFTAENNKDIILEDRIKVYYQNVSYCEEGCELININTETLQANCSCDVKTDFLNNIFDNSVTGDYLEMINDANFKVIKCYKNVFDSKHFIVNAGSYIMLICIISQIPFLIIYIINGLTSIRVNLFQFFLNNPPIRNTNNNQNIDSNLQNEIENINNNNQNNNNNNNSTYSNKTYTNNNNTNTNNNNNNNNNNENNDDNNNNYGTPTPFIKKDPKKLMVMVINNNYFDDEEPNSLEYSRNNYSSMSNSIKSNTRLKKNKSDSKIYKSPSIKKKKLKKKNFEKINLNKEKIIISTESSFSEEEDNDLNTMELYDALKYDKRSFCEFYWEQLKEKQDIIRTFFNKNPYELFPIKIMIFIFGIGMFFIFNGLFYSESYISERYWTKKEDFMFILKNQITKCFYSSICVVILNSLVEFLANSKNEIESLINKKKNKKKFQEKILKRLKSIKRNYLIFIIIDFIVLFFGWYYLSALCNVYHNSQKDWIIGCFITFFLIQLFPFLLCLIVACLRFMGLKCKFETAYKLSICLTD